MEMSDNVEPSLPGGAPNDANRCQLDDIIDWWPDRLRTLIFANRRKAGVVGYELSVIGESSEAEPQTESQDGSCGDGLYARRSASNGQGPRQAGTRCPRSRGSAHRRKRRCYGWAGDSYSPITINQKLRVLASSREFFPASPDRVQS